MKTKSLKLRSFVSKLVKSGYSILMMGLEMSGRATICDSRSQKQSLLKKYFPA